MARVLFTVLLVSAVVASLLGCYEKPMAASGTDNPNVPVSLLFTHAGVTVYRFIDAGRAVYFTVPSVPIESSAMCGKQTCIQRTFPLTQQDIPR